MRSHLPQLKSKFLRREEPEGSADIPKLPNITIEDANAAWAILGIKVSVPLVSGY